MTNVWCSICLKDSSIEYAILDKPCPVCGKKSYFITDISDADSLENLSQRMQRIGKWDIAYESISKSLQAGYISKSEFNLLSAQLSERMSCVGQAIILKCHNSINLKSDLLNSFDAFTVNWVLTEYTGWSK